MMEGASVVYVIDDDPAVVEGLDSLLRSVGYVVFSFNTADAFLSFTRPDKVSCLLLDIRMPGPSGLELQDLLVGRKDALPIIFLSGHGDVPISVRAMKSGAVDFLLKPVHEQTLLDAVRGALEKDRAQRVDSSLAASFDTLFNTLTKREAEVIGLVVEGKANKEIAARLDLKEITIKVNRANAMRKLECKTVVDLVKRMKSRPQ